MASRLASVKWVYTRDFGSRLFPLVFLSGRASYVLAQWAHFLIKQGIGQSLLDERLRVVVQLFEYATVKYGSGALTEGQTNTLVADYLMARKLGTVDAEGFDPLGLWWPRLSKKTLKKYVKAINAFDAFQAAFHGAPRLNPVESRLLTAWQRCQEFRVREKWDMLLHLFPASSTEKAIHSVDVVIEHTRFRIGKKKIPKAFPLHSFIDLVEKSPSPRDRMLWLLMFGLALRQSEPLHMYLEDCFGIDRTGGTRIRLDDPEIGEYRWVDKSGSQRSGTRTDYLMQCFRNEDLKDTIPDLYLIKPRTQYGGYGGMRVGFKGMTFDYDDSGVVEPRVFGNEAVWIDPRLGIYFHKCLEEYLREHFYTRGKGWPYHPFLFICLDKDDYGMPLTIPAIRKAWTRALKRLGMENCGLGPHSLRHLAGYYSATVLKQPIEFTKSMLRHANISSTEVYYHLDSNEVRNRIMKASAQYAGYEFSDYLLFPGAQPLSFPEHWGLNAR